MSPYFITLPELAELCRVTEATISNWNKDGVEKMPPPIRLGPNKLTATKMWRKSDIYEWLDSLEGTQHVPFVGNMKAKKN
jgi:predicted DNA-binding transcriptional regulator AlpA